MRTTSLAGCPLYTVAEVVRDLHDCGFRVIHVLDRVFLISSPSTHQWSAIALNTPAGDYTPDELWLIARWPITLHRCLEEK